MFWLEALTFAVMVGLSLCALGWLRQHPELTLWQVLGRLAGSVAVLAFGLVALWDAVPGLRDSGFFGLGLFLLTMVLRELPVVQALSEKQRYGLYVLAAGWFFIAIMLLLRVVRPDGPRGAILDFFLLMALILLAVTPVVFLIAWLRHRSGRRRGAA